MRRLFAIAILMGSPVAQCDAIAPTFRVYGSGEGLPSPSTMDLSQDREGRVWVATRDGLGRFDGREFAVFRHVPDQADSLPCNDVQTVLATRDGRIWVGCESTGLAMLEHGDDVGFTRIAPDPAGDGLRGGDVFALHETPGGDLYIGTYAQGLARWRAGASAPVALDRLAEFDPELGIATVLDMTMDAEGVLWVGTLDALWRIDGADADVPGPARKVAELPLVNAVHAARDGRLWVGVNGALFVRARGADDLVRVPLPEGAGLVDGFADAADGTVWVAVGGGLLRLRPDGGRDWIRPRAAVNGALPDRDIRDLMLDHEGGLWLSTGSHGLAYLRPDWERFQVFRHDPLDPTTPSSGRRSGLAHCPDDSLWMLVRNASELTRVSPEGEVARWRSPRHADTLARRRLSGIFCDGNGVLWLPDREGVLRFDPRQDTLSDGLQSGQPWAAGVSETLARSRDGRLWIGALTAGLNVLSPDGRNAVWRAGEHGLDNDDFEQITADPEGRIWIADAAGLRYLDDAGSAMVAVDALPRERVHAFAFLDAGRLLVHRLGQVALLHRDGGRWHVAWTLAQADGVPIAEAGTMVVAHDGGVLLTNPRGLWRIDVARRRIEPVTRAEGLPDVQFEVMPSAAVQGADLWFLVGEGMLRARLGTASTTAGPPPLRWAPLRFQRGDDVGVLGTDVPLLDFGPDDHELAIGARLLSFIEPREHRYRFRIDGFDADWVDVGAGGERLIARLPAGDYRVQVHAENALGQAAAPLTRRLVVAPPWWASRWAIAGYALLAALTFMGLWRANRRRLDARHAMALAEERRRQAESANAAKSEFLATVGHEIRTPMTGVLGMAELLAGTPLDEKQRHYVETVQQSGRHLLHLVNDLLDLSRAEAGKLGLAPRPTDLSALLREVFDGFVPLAQRKGLDCVLALADDMPARVEVDPVRVRQVVLNLLNNALKFTASGRIVLRASSGGESLAIEVEDTGPGMTAEECARLFQRFAQTSFGAGLGGSGLGLSIVHQITQIMGGDVRLRSTPGVGSVFTVRLPLVPVAAGERVAAMVPVARAANGDLRVALLVEDDAATREVIATWLRRDGIDVRVADQAMLALHHADGAIDLIVSDLDLPGMGGLKLLPLLRQRVGRVVPALAITARSEANTEAEARAAGFDAFLRKPLDAATLRASLRDLAAQRNPAA
jgi:signal transduction histidine kinase/ligand-binding sensor domain-containing protein/CheY-like chemotaxis protein